MFRLKQKELYDWQAKNFPRSRYEAMRKEQLIDIIITLQATLGMCEEVGEIAHAVLKGTQNIREGIDGINRAEVGDGFGDVNIYGQQLLSELYLDAEEEIEKATKTVLARNWVDNPKTGTELKEDDIELHMLDYEEYSDDNNDDCDNFNDEHPDQYQCFCSTCGYHICKCD